MQEQHCHLVAFSLYCNFLLHNMVQPAVQLFNHNSDDSKADCTDTTLNLVVNIHTHVSVNLAQTTQDKDYTKASVVCSVEVAFKDKCTDVLQKLLEACSVFHFKLKVQQQQK